MPKIKKLNFIPSIDRYRTIEKESYCRISKMGILTLPKKTLINLGFKLDGITPIYLYEDLPNRVIGFRIDNKIVKEKNLRLIKPFHSKQGAVYVALSINFFLKQLNGVEYPLPKLIIKKYSDRLTEELYYITIPLK